MGGFLGALEYVLEEGPQNDWFEDTSIMVCAVVCAISAIAFFARVFTARVPIVDLRAFTNRNFALGCTFSFCVGIGLYGLTYLYPRYLAEVRGYSALMIGETMFVSGVAMFMTAPLVGRLMTKVDMRYLIFTGLLLFAAGTWQMTWITRDFDFYELLLPQILRGIGMMMAMVPVNNIALGTLAPELVKNASGLFNLTRNLGGAVGLALLNTMLNSRTDFHISRLHDKVTWGNTTAVETLNMLTQKFSGLGDAPIMALKQLTQIVHRQAVVMGFGDSFLLLTFFYVGLSAMVVLLAKPANPMAAPGGH
jgi:DHA2 family multidrug resistance protein